MDRFNVAVDVVQNAGDLLRQCRLEESEICQKTGHQDLVTHWDRKIEQLLRNEILTAFPQDSIVGEEYPPEAHRTGSMTWYIDPIDGTTNFINQHQNYAISVGCWEGSTPLFGLVLDVERETLYWAKRGGGAWQDQTQIHTSGRRELSELLLTTPGLQYTFLEPHSYQERMIRLSRKVRGVRCLGSVALELCEVATGRPGGSVRHHALLPLGSQRGADHPGGGRRRDLHSGRGRTAPGSEEHGARSQCYGTERLHPLCMRTARRKRFEGHFWSIVIGKHSHCLQPRKS